MIGILIIAHGTLGESLVHCASHVLNKRPGRLRQLGVTAQDDPPLLLPQARALVKELDGSRRRGQRTSAPRRRSYLQRHYFRPPPPEPGRTGTPTLPHIRLDRALQFLLGDRLA